MSDKNNEKRRGLRVTFRTTVKLIFPGGLIVDECETRDISVAGVFVKNIKGTDFAGKCQVELHLAGRTSNLVLEMAGEVVRAQDDGIALQFLDVDEDSFYHLQNIVYFSYKHSGVEGEMLAAIGDVEDESLYEGLTAGRRAKPLPDNYLDETDDDDSDDADDDDIEGGIAKQIGRFQDDEDY